MYEWENALKSVKQVFVSVPGAFEMKWEFFFV